MKKTLLYSILFFVFYSCNKDTPKQEPASEPVKDEVVKEVVKAPTKKVVPKLIFTVQIGAFETENPNFSSIAEVKIYKEDNLFKYRLGTFETYQAARKERAKLVTKYPDAFVQAVKGSTSLPIKRALKMSN